MKKTIFITGSTDGIGLETAKSLLADGHKVILHGRNAEKLAHVEDDLGGGVESHVADLSDLKAVSKLAADVLAKHDHIDVLINNAGIFKTPSPRTCDDLDIRFVVNTIAPYLLTQKLMSVLTVDARVVNLSSAAQAPVKLSALKGEGQLADMDAYAQSKLAITMWTTFLKDAGPMMVAVNPGSLLASKMVREGFGTAGNDINIGVDILKRASLSEEFANVSGRYFDNDARQFSAPHPAGEDMAQAAEIVQAMDDLIAKLT
ncbi:SDR family NAD(P)-dependent oxidoreductase [Terasakiella sp. A23]|uniref:SDR family NAD(P)-dependent oxidoreductase n=1 Tax=Terasakiella sp. FCG-A23 TaxID=3080561 RepID=UPI002953E948|nr:SDR family NAD(P)-dependent oxidoreductase [Terasakiella sp. A23]MDV7341044.1 SDR family NAD(P)-dependent oxidoreductase [Terasakiella sp. A23]